MNTCKTTCPYCGVGCGVVASVEGRGDIRITGDDDHPANYGRLCVKGATLADTLPGAGRLLQPQYSGTPLSWDNALDRIAETIQRVLRESGPEAIACYLSDQLLTEDYYVANKLMKGFLDCRYPPQLYWPQGNPVTGVPVNWSAPAGKWLKDRLTRRLLAGLARWKCWESVCAAVPNAGPVCRS